MTGKVIIFAPLLALALSAEPASFQRALSELQRSPDDAVLREKVIREAAALKVPVPGEADELSGWAEAALKNAKMPEDYETAERAYQKALALAPWSADAYRGLAAAQEKLGRYPQAEATLRFYLLASPDAADARDVRRRMGALAYQAAGQASAHAAEGLVARFKRLAPKHFDFVEECGREDPLQALRARRRLECDREEFAAQRWRRTELTSTRWLKFPEDGVIQVWSRSGLHRQLELQGRPGGDGLDDIAWARCLDRGGCAKPIWVRWAEDLSSYTVSLDRPVAEKDFDAKARYAYVRFSAAPR